jgi:hypothetical protein
VPGVERPRHGLGSVAGSPVASRLLLRRGPPPLFPVLGRRLAGTWTHDYYTARTRI